MTPPDGFDLSGLRLLVVEDMLLVAELIVDVLEEHGCQVVGPAPKIVQAMNAVREGNLNGAVLDVNLDGYPCFPVAEALQQRNIPFVFLTGYGDSLLFPPEFRSVPRLHKPFENQDLARLAWQEFRSAGAGQPSSPQV